MYLAINYSVRQFYEIIVCACVAAMFIMEVDQTETTCTVSLHEQMSPIIH